MQYLTAYVQRFLAGEVTPESLEYPVLLWEMGERSGGGDIESLPTQSGAGVPMGPRPGNPLVLPLKLEATQSKVGGLSIGRSESNDVVVDNESVSRFHALIHFDSRRCVWHITDAGSRNGTKVDGKTLGSEETVTLRERAEILLGKAQLRFFTPQAFVDYLRTSLQDPSR
jgi:pSer/pThr/pTyr-binding forkhead associated (FHA) protein